VPLHAIVKLVAPVPGQEIVMELLPPVIVTFGDVAESVRLSVTAMVQVDPPAPDPGTVKLAFHVPLPELLVNPETVDDPEHPVPPHVALVSDVGAVPT
jgi:hypothetical protein